MRVATQALVVVALLLAAAEAPAREGVSIRRDGGAFVVAGLGAEELARLSRMDAKQLAEAFRVAVAGPDREERPAMLGAYSVQKGLLRFEPRFPLQPGVRYQATFRGVGASFDVPKADSKPTTVVTHVYPSADTLPENHLRFYLHFSSPMTRGEAYKHLRLLDAAGKERDAVFLELYEELWDPSGTRLTLLFDPGRVKRELVPREELGPVLEAGKSYTLVVNRAWADAKGNPLRDGFRKTFRAGKVDEQPVEPKEWRVAAPAGPGKGSLTVTFPKPLDHALLFNTLWVTDASGKRVPGTVAVSNAEKTWQFTPQAAWAAGAYDLVVDTILEDPCGNRVGRPFEVDLFKPVQRKVLTETVKVPFRVPGAAPR